MVLQKNTRCISKGVCERGRLSGKRREEYENATERKD